MKYLINIYEFLNEAKIEDIYSKYYSDIEQEMFIQVISADPTTVVKDNNTKMGMYSKWLLNLYKSNNLLIEDLYKATNYLSKFHELKRTNKLNGKDADINSYKSLPDLLDILMSIGGTGSVAEDESYLLTDRYYINSGEAELFYEDNKYLIVIPKTLDASQFYAYNPKASDRKSEWCTYYPDNFNDYTNKGFLYIIIDKDLINTNDTNRRLQFHFETSSFMDIRDSELPIPIRLQFMDIFSKKRSDGFKLKYDRAGDFRDGRAVVKLNKKWGYVDTDGNEVVPLKYDYVGDFCEGRAWVKLNQKYGFVDKDGNEIIPLRYDEVGSFREGRAWVRINKKYGFVDLDGNEVIPLKYDNVNDFREGRAMVRINKKYGFIDLDGKEVIPPKYDGIGDFSGGRAYVSLNGKYGFVDKDGNEVIPLKYVRVGYFREGRAMVRINKKYGFVDLDGNEVVPLKYYNVGNFKEGRVWVILNEKWGFVDLDGNEVVPPKYDRVGNFSEGRAWVRLNKKFGFVDLDGNEYFD
jgi:hypothetical protein